MSPEKKVREVIFKMWGNSQTSDISRELDDAICCALEAVILILCLELREIPYKLYSGPPTSCRDYWEEVKLKLEKL